MIRDHRIAAVSLAAVILHVQPVLACICADPGPPCQAFWNTPVVFLGRVEAIVRSPDGDRSFSWDRVRFRVLEHMRGPDVKEIEVLNSRTNCGLAFREGADWIVYASAFEDGPPGLYTGVCSRSSVLKDAPEDLEYARSTRLPAPKAGRVFGTVTYRTNFPERFNQEPVGGVRVTLAASGGSVSASTDRNGRFDVRLPAARYRIGVAFPPGNTTMSKDASIAVPHNHACAQVHVSAEYPGQLVGRVLTASGAPVPNLPVELMTDQRDYAPSRQRALTDAHGRFRAPILAGRYVPAVAIDHGEWDRTEDGIDTHYVFAGGAVSKEPQSAHGWQVDRRVSSATSFCRKQFGLRR